MPATKLTLSADGELVERAKKLAEEEGTSLSSMFDRYLRAVLAARQGARPGPVTRRATGVVRLPAGRSDRELVEAALLERHAPRR